MPSRTRTGIVWFRRDLRLHDQPALRAAIDEHERVVPVFCFDDRLLHGRHESGARTQFLLECLAELDAELRERGSRLVVRHGRPERELPALAREVGARAIHLTEDVSPFARRRGELTGRALADAGVALCPHQGLNAIDVRAIETKAGEPYTLFSPFHRTWLQIPRRALLDPPGHLQPLPAALAVGRLPTLGSLGLTQEVAEPARGGEAEARAALDRFIDDPVRGYAESHDALGSDQTSRLSPYLHFGCVSARAIEERLPSGEGGDAFHRQLCWRDFYHHVLLNNPSNALMEFQARYRGAIRWSRARRPFGAWCEGRTGYPLVDAGMRQLLREGWMHNRARLVAGSFLTKHLGIDWRWGERWFMRLLIDGDEANNNGNWQWIASVGTDRQPASRRILNPARQQERYDPDHAYVRRYVRELRAVPDEYMAEPSTMPADLQRETGCVIGEDYPAPIVDHRQAREEALERYRI